MESAYEHIEKEVVRISENVGGMIREASKGSFRDSIKKKGDHDYVTEVDEKAEKMFVEELGNLLPDAGFIAEEGTSEKEGEVYQWVIDPLDGTTNFIHGIPSFCTSVALLKNEEPVVGVVYEINRDERFHASKDNGAFMNGAPIHVSPAPELTDSLIVTGFPHENFPHFDEYLEVFKTLLLRSRGGRRLGSAAADLAYVACGRFEVFYEFGLKPWDVAAGAILVEEAGGTVTDFSKGREHLFGREIIASNGKIHQEFHELFSSIYPTDAS